MKQNTDSAYDCLLRYNENCRSRKQKRKNQSITTVDSGPFDLSVFRCCFRLRQSSFQCIISDGVVNGIGRNGNVLILPTPLNDSDFRFSLGHKRSYDSDSDYNSVASENKPLSALILINDPILILQSAPP